MSSVQKRIWIVPFLYGAMLFAASGFWLLVGAPFDTATYSRVAGVPWPQVTGSMNPATALVFSALVREVGGNTGLVAAVLIMTVSATAFRSGDRWSWYALWALPVHSMIDLVVVTTYGALSLAVIVWDAGLFAAMLVTLWLSSGKCLWRP